MAKLLSIIDKLESRMTTTETKKEEALRLKEEPEPVLV